MLYKSYQHVEKIGAIETDYSSKIIIKKGIGFRNE